MLLPNYSCDTFIFLITINADCFFIFGPLLFAILCLDNGIDGIFWTGPVLFANSCIPTNARDPRVLKNSWFRNGPYGTNCRFAAVSHNGNKHRKKTARMARCQFSEMTRETTSGRGQKKVYLLFSVDLRRVKKNWWVNLESVFWCQLIKYPWGESSRTILYFN